jgi:hypothetical protein
VRGARAAARLEAAGRREPLDRAEPSAAWQAGFGRVWQSRLRIRRGALEQRGIFFADRKSGASSASDVRAGKRIASQLQNTVKVSGRGPFGNSRAVERSVRWTLNPGLRMLGKARCMC